MGVYLAKAFVKHSGQVYMKSRSPTNKQLYSFAPTVKTMVAKSLRLRACKRELGLLPL